MPKPADDKQPRPRRRPYAVPTLIKRDKLSQIAGEPAGTSGIVADK